MQDTTKSQDTVRRKRKIAMGGLAKKKKGMRKAKWIYWKKFFLQGWRRGTDKGQHGASSILLKCPTHFPLPSCSGSSSELGAGAGCLLQACRAGAPGSAAEPGSASCEQHSPIGVRIRT